MKAIAVPLVRHLPVQPATQEAILFYLKLGYWPDFRNPRTFNEKLNHRKLFSQDVRITTCSDKLAVRDWVRDRIGAQYLIPLLFEGETITADQLYALGDHIVAKANHDYKSSEIIHRNSPVIAAAAAERLQAKLRINFGRETNQFWYSTIQPRILVERLLMEGNKPSPNDYKIFCFRQPDGSTRKLIEVHLNRGTPDFNLLLFEEDRTPIVLKGESSYKRTVAPFPCPDHWDHLLRVADILGRDFDHVRVDLYCINGKIYFGELSFCDGGGRSRYTRLGGTPNDMDREIGAYWHLER